VAQFAQGLGFDAISQEPLKRCAGQAKTDQERGIDAGHGFWRNRAKYAAKAALVYRANLIAEAYTKGPWLKPRFLKAEFRGLKASVPSVNCDGVQW
jgi:hypothetical protein